MRTKPFAFKACPSDSFTEMYKEDKSFYPKRQEVLKDFNSSKIYDKLLKAAKRGKDNHLIKAKHCSCIVSADKLKVIMDDILSNEMRWLKCDIVYDISGDKYFMQFSW